MSGTGKTVFVTGGGGFVASHCIVELLKEDFEVIAVDNFVNSIKGKSQFLNRRTFFDPLGQPTVTAGRIIVFAHIVRPSGMI